MNNPSVVRPGDRVFEVADDYIVRQSTSEDLARTLRALWSTFYRNRLLIGGIMASSMLGGLGVTILMTPKFTATATIQIDQQAANVLGDKDQDVQQGDGQDADRFLQTEADVLQSRALAQAVMQDLRLDSSDEFVRRMGDRPASRPAGSLSLLATKQEQILRILNANLKVSLPRNSRIVPISFTSRDPRLAALVANGFAADFMTFSMKRKFESSSYARNFLENQLNDTRVKLEASERALLDYARTAHLLDVSGGIAAGGDASTAAATPRSLTTSNLVELNDAYAQAQTARVQAEQHWDQASTAQPLQLQEVLTNPAVMQLAQSKAEAQATYQQELQRHKPDYPQMQQAAAHIAELDRQLHVLAESIRGSIKQQYVTALKQEQALARQVEDLKGSTQSEQGRSVEYNILKRSADSNRLMYDSLLQRYSEVSAQAGVAANNISQVDVASIPLHPISPRPLINLTLAALVGLLAAASFVLLRDKFDDSIRTPEDVPVKLGLTFLNATPLLADQTTPTEELEDPRSPLSEAYSALRVSIELGHKGGVPRTLAVTSTRQSEGKSTTAFAIARNFAKMGRRVILIDGDLRKPSLHRLANVSNEKGFANLLARLAKADDVIQLSGVDGLSVISAGPLPPNPAELLSGDRLGEVIRELSGLCDIVIVDAPPVLGLADTMLIGSNTDAMIFVVEANGSHHGHAKAAVRRILANNISILGVVLSKYDARKIGYGYGYGYNYAYSYEYGGASDRPSAKPRKGWFR